MKEREFEGEVADAQAQHATGLLARRRVNTGAHGADLEGLRERVEARTESC
jgi:hypothetical protein